MSKDIREQINKFKNLFKILTEETDSIKFINTEDEDDRHTINAYIGKNKVGSITMEILFDSYIYEFSDVFSEDEFDEMFPENEIVKIESINVIDGYRGNGIAKKLMSEALDKMKTNGHTQFYLNAYPMGFHGLNVSSLIEFYKKFNFEVILDQGNNALMRLILYPQ